MQRSTMKLNQVSAIFNKARITASNIAIFGTALTAMLIAPSLAAQTQGEDASANEDLEVIQVKGIAGSLAESARQKRFDSRIVDAIVAEDIGKLPDNNIAEALQRITGEIGRAHV